MRGLMKLPVLLIALNIIVGCTQQPTITAAQRAAMHNKELKDAGLKYYWKWKLPLDGETIVRTYLLDDNLYCLTNTNRLIAIDAAHGVLRWAKWVHVAKPGVEVFDPVHVNNIFITRTPPTKREILQPRKGDLRKAKSLNGVIISTKTHALLIDQENGDEIRNIKFNFNAGASAGVCSDGRSLFVPDSRGWYHAILLHQMIENWTMSVEGTVTVAPRYVDDKVIIASEKGRVQVTRSFETRKKIWTRMIHAAIEAPIIATKDYILVPCMDRRLYAFDTSTGQELWTAFDCKKPLTDAPQASEVSAFQYTRGGKFYALALVSGKLRWTLPNARTVLAAMDNNVYLQDSRNRILVVDEIMGDVKNSIQMPPGHMLSANTSAPGIFGVTRNGSMYCIRSVNAGYLTAETLRKETK
ncbi:MAG: PQQ-binding-like beta-propeller repeat protein [bacterium]|nr:PQQ-binding-like beta-propeller repeat protein [bacterium]